MVYLPDPDEIVCRSTYFELPSKMFVRQAVKYSRLDMDRGCSQRKIRPCRNKNVRLLGGYILHYWTTEKRAEIRKELKISSTAEYTKRNEITLLYVFIFIFSERGEDNKIL
jgi:hypothetical protein